MVSRKATSISTSQKPAINSISGGNPFTTSYQFYGARDKVDDRTVNDIYDGTAWLQALTFGYKVAEVVDLRLEGTWVKADGQQGYFLAAYDPDLRLIKRSPGYLVG